MTPDDDIPYSFIKSIVPFCGVSNVDDCIVEYVLLLWPYYIFILILLPVRTYEIRLLPRSYPPQWWPLSHLMKRVTVLMYVGTVVTATAALLLVHTVEPYVLLSATIHITCWITSYWILSSEYKRYQPLTWFGLRGFWLLTGFEGVFRSIWLISSPIDSTPTYGVSFPAITLMTTLWLTLLECVMALLVVFVPNDLNVNLLGHIQRLLLEHPSANSEYCTSQPAIYTLHEDDNNTMSRESKRRADTPGWIYSVEEELPFYPKIDVVDVFVLAVNRDKRIKTVYRIHTRVTTDTQMVVEFNAKRRYRELRFLDDKLRSVFDHSKFPEQRAGLGNFPPRELTQADPFARQIAIREYLRRLSGNPIFYTQEFLDMVGIDPRFDSGRLYESCLGLQGMEQGKLPVRPGQLQKQRLTIEPMPWRPPAASLSSGTVSPIGRCPSPPPNVSVKIVSFFEFKKVIYYKIITEIGSHVCESKHRFSDFQRLSVHLKDFLGVKPSVALPRLIRIPGSQSVADFLETRRNALQVYLGTILADYPNVVSSRFVRTFFKLPADLVLPSTPFGSEAAEWDTNEEQTTHNRLQTPTGSNMSFKLGQSQQEEPEAELVSSFLQASIPFVTYCVSTDPPSVRFCVRMETTDCSEWTRFHTFEEFLVLKNELNLNWNHIDSGLEFPPVVSHFRLVHSDEGKLRDENRRRGLAVWLSAVLDRSKGQHIEPLWKFIRSEDEVEEDSFS